MTSERKLVVVGSPFSILYGEERVNTTSMGKMKYMRPYWKWFEFSKPCYLGFVQEMTNIASGKLIIWGLKRSHRTSSLEDRQLSEITRFFWEHLIRLMATRHLARKPVEVGSFSRYLRGFLRGISSIHRMIGRIRRPKIHWKDGDGWICNFFVVTFTFVFFKLTWWQQKSPIATKHLHMHKTFGIWYLNLLYFGLLSYYPLWILWSKKSPTGATKRTPKTPEYLIARSQLTWGPFGPIQFLVGYGIFQNGTQEPWSENFWEANIFPFFAIGFHGYVDGIPQGDGFLCEECGSLNFPS